MCTLDIIFYYCVFQVDLLHGMERVVKVQEVRNGKSSEIQLLGMKQGKEVTTAEVEALVKG